MRVDVHEGKLADLVAAVKAGEEVVIEQDGAAVAYLAAIPQDDTSRRKRDGPEAASDAREPAGRPRPFRFGSLKGQLGRTPDFFEPMDEEDLRLWEGRGDDPAP